MACWICTLGSACSSIFELNSAMTYFHALTNGLAMDLAPPSCLVVCQMDYSAHLEAQFIGSTRIATPLLPQSGLGNGHGDDRRDDDLGADVDIGRAGRGNRVLPARQLLTRLDKQLRQRHIQRVADRAQQLAGRLLATALDLGQIPQADPRSV